MAGCVRAGGTEHLARRTCTARRRPLPDDQAAAGCQGESRKDIRVLLPTW